MPPPPLPVRFLELKEKLRRETPQGASEPFGTQFNPLLWARPLAFLTGGGDRRRQRRGTGLHRVRERRFGGGAGRARGGSDGGGVTGHWRGRGAGVARAWRGLIGIFGLGGAGVARAWRGRGAGMSCDPSEHIVVIRNRHGPIGAYSEEQGNPTQTLWPELLLLGLKPNKKKRENRSLVIPCSNIQAKACFGHAGLFTVTLADVRMHMVDA
eukprot:gene16722-biopygen14346